MHPIHYIKLENFKIFEQETFIPLSNLSVLIGANNSGKTSVIQALSLWSWAIQTWIEKKKKSKSLKERGVALYRKEIPQVMIKEMRFFWHKAKIRKDSNTNTELKIKVGLFWKNQLQEVGVLFKYHSPEIIYCQPDEKSLANKEILEYAEQIKINLLYPIVGMKPEEDYLGYGSIQRIIGQGQAASVIRNICNYLYENDKAKWQELVNLIKTLFAVELKKPIVLPNGLIELYFNYATKELKSIQDLDISLAGYGQQQMLLVIAYLLANPNSVLMIDEPDAHLEILRQSQIFALLKYLAQKYSSQIIIVTHSEVILNEAEHVIFLQTANAQEISNQNNETKFVKEALRHFGIEHYYKAQINPHILYVESSSDLEILRAFARKLNHPALNTLNGLLNYYFIKNEISEETIEDELGRISGGYRSCKSHFQAIKSVVPRLKGIGIFDSDAQKRQNEINDHLAILFWERYEIENYFITPQTIEAFARKEWEKRLGSIFSEYIQQKVERLRNIIESELILPVLNQDLQALQDFKDLTINLQNQQFQNMAVNHKLSKLLENVFNRLSELEKEPLLLTKSNFYVLIDFLNNINEEVKKKLDMIQKYLEN
ncbi:AAA family ATPase [Raineya sp.]|jgi:ABC-type cobalamin/Fe3+-siderophores transport system ATPase subunit